MGKKKPVGRVVPAERAAGLVPADLLKDLRSLIEEAREAAARSVNSALVLLYWGIGTRIRTEVLKERRAEYGKQILGTLSQELSEHYGKGYTYDNLTRMVKLAEVFPEREILSTLSKELGWSHFVELLPLTEPLKRDFYAEMCRVERWSVRTLREKMDSPEARAGRGRPRRLRWVRVIRLLAGSGLAAQQPRPDHTPTDAVRPWDQSRTC
jgi:predicted nuclease of restriction endonuclease-like (RecB) superfamily